MFKFTVTGLSYSNAPISYVKYFYAPDGSITAREVNGIKQNYEYDVKNQLTAVTDTQGNILEQYTYDPAGNILEKTINGVTTTFEYDDANQLTSSLPCPNAKSSIANSYDSAGRMIKEGNKTYIYGWLDKVMSITQSTTSVPPRQGDSLKGLSYSRIDYDYHISQRTDRVRAGSGTATEQGK